MHTHNEPQQTSTRPTCRVRFHGTMPGYGHLPPLQMFNILELSAPSDLLCVNSTVTLRTVRNAGFEPVMEAGPTTWRCP
jgi:hypothetical protein